jgi:hypothetical protein
MISSAVFPWSRKSHGPPNCLHVIDFTILASFQKCAGDMSAVAPWTLILTHLMAPIGALRKHLVIALNRKGIGWSEGQCGSDRAPVAFLLDRHRVELSSAADWRHVSTAAAVQAGSELDVHHVPETNGRMSVCRRCGSQTDGPEGRHHIPAERQLIRSGEWLAAQSRIGHIDRIRMLRQG